VPKGTLGANDEAVWQKDKFFVTVLRLFEYISEKEQI